MGWFRAWQHRLASLCVRSNNVLKSVLRNDDLNVCDAILPYLAFDVVPEVQSLVVRRALAFYFLTPYHGALCCTSPQKGIGQAGMQ